MRVSRDDGVVLNAEFGVEVDGGHLAVILESAGGRVPGAGHARNHEYVPALDLLLARLAARDAVLLRALLASARVSGWPESERLLLDGPISLAAGTTGLRKQLTRAQGFVGRAEGAVKEGNNRKRILLRVDVPGYTTDDPRRLARDLAAPAPGSPAEAVLRGLVGHTIHTSTGLPNTVLGIRGDKVLVGTDKSPEGQPVPIADVQHGMEILAADGIVRISPPVLGHRSTFVGAVLATLPDARFTASPTMVTTAAPGATPDPDLLDALAEAERTAGRTRRSGQGRGLTQPQKIAVERRAMDLATEHLTSNGWTVRDVGATHSYDIDATRPGEHLYVEVKGTTSAGDDIILTRREVELMTEKHPHTMLAVVHGIQLDRTADTPQAVGGTLDIYFPWKITPDRLIPISYQYRTEKNH